jgi:23S rRNA (uracil1939-C5)-methyltransferase
MAQGAQTCLITPMKPPRPSPRSAATRATLTIRDLGAQGDGVADVDGRPVFVGLTLPGETITADIEGDRGRLIDVVTPGPDRVGPRCAHYGVCGGCSLQHMAGSAYLAFKRRLVVDALAAKGIDAPADVAIAVPPASRRRAVFAAARYGKSVTLGFHGRRSHALVPIRDCPVLTPGIQAALPALQKLAASTAPPKGALTITVVDSRNGLDVALNGVGKWFSADARMNLVMDAQAAGLARIAVDGEVILERAAPGVRAGAALVVAPPGGFLQATAPSEAAMLTLVEQAVGDARRIADLFAGCGTFALPLASRASVHAVEGDADAIAALDAAARRTPSLKAVSVEKRDLFRRPLTRDELKRFDAVVMDPPRAGAEAQAANLAASDVARIAMVSCNPVTLARDLRLLIDGGYRLDRVTPVDQFLWSHHIEVVAALSR